jgi:peptidoglycan/xylan/chitin deacetylase (PgdA/CDA1 family)
MQRRIRRFAALGIAFSMAVVPVSYGDDPNALRNLPPAEQPRFEIKDRDWPAKPGEASVCLWRDDKLAAVSITIDDNTVPDHAWWLEQSKKYGWKFTWFVITARVNSGNAFFGVWEDFIKLHEAGHDVQSHTVTHFSDKVPGGDVPLDVNYGRAITDIEKNVPGAKVLTLAYPGGDRSKENDPAVAAKYYIAARGTTGHLNMANKVNYINTNSLSAGAPLEVGHWAGLPNLIKKADVANRAAVWRGWCSIHYHGMGGDGEKSIKPKTIEMLDYLKANEADLWVAPFTQVAQYGQQRDTADLKSAVDGDAIKITLKDKMDDKLFDFPLTVKVRLDPSWEGVTAQQADKEAPATVIEHDGAKFALVQIVPDRGDAIVKKK